MKNSLMLIIAGLVIIGYQIVGAVRASYTYEQKYSQLWSLADKSSTIPAKQQYISQFVTALKEGHDKGVFADNSALFLKTPNNSFEANLKALQSLSDRLTEIQSMNPSSFEYNTAIQQITAQEQGEAHAMLSVFRGCYDINNYLHVWDWVGLIVCLLGAGLIFIGFCLFDCWY